MFFKDNFSEDEAHEETKISQYPHNMRKENDEQDEWKTMKPVYASPEQFQGNSYSAFSGENSPKGEAGTTYDLSLSISGTTLVPETNMFDALSIRIGANCSMLISRAKHLASMQYSLDRFDELIKELDLITEDLKRLGSMSEDAIRIRDEIEK